MMNEDTMKFLIWLCSDKVNMYNREDLDKNLEEILHQKYSEFRGWG